MKRKLYIEPSFESIFMNACQLCELSQTGADGLDPTSESDDDEYTDEDDVGVKDRQDDTDNPYGLW